MSSELSYTNKTPILRTERTIITRLSPSYAHLWVKYVTENREHLTPWEPERDESFYSLESAKMRLQKATEAFQEGSSVLFTILPNDPFPEDIIGFCNFSNIVRGVSWSCKLGYSISQKYEGQGYMREAIAVGIQYMFDIVGMHRITADHMPNNHKSAKLLQSLGFEREGYAKKLVKINGQWEDHILNALINPRI